MILEEIIDQIHPLQEPSRKQLVAIFEEETYPKSHILIRAQKIEPKLYFMKKGIVRGYSEFETGDITFWFGKEGNPILSMKSYVENKRGYENIELLEPSTVYSADSHTLKLLFKKDIAIANWGRILAEQELIKTEERLISRQLRTATERYQELISNEPDLIKRVPLNHIASYLGITQVSLSRIRASLK
ncbi:Crp/Fnr family transcriptional regulator [Cellulophaga sp. HaHa_2_95]|uniref:Crp/Fnr family transcriptional regulator n=1 Tax=Cellulophaga sp. HaHa_2_95 TaxID=2745558 RepID=UPI001C4FC84E|nr:Crp/Fnr family transcriptional regulator [Cellulophaga sp. HaHa_2_95]QXP56540.1 Crp/Fnr family transcriptional regulator [Cellulophaga sp. HaHa_2_95]